MRQQIAKGERIIADLKRLKWNDGDLQQKLKTAPDKLVIAVRLRKETTQTTRQIAQRLHMGSWKSLRSKSTCKTRPRQESGKMTKVQFDTFYCRKTSLAVKQRHCWMSSRCGMANHARLTPAKRRDKTGTQTGQCWRPQTRMSHPAAPSPSQSSPTSTGRWTLATSKLCQPRPRRASARSGLGIAT